MKGMSRVNVNIKVYKRSDLYSVARLFLIKSIEETKYIPIISERNSTTLLEESLPTLDSAKKNFTEKRKGLI